MRAWLPGGKQAPEPTPEESKSLSHFRVGNVLEPIEPLTGIARHPFARVGCGGGVDLCGNQIYGAFRVDLHAIDATPARWRGGAASSPLDGAGTAASSTRNEHPSYWLIFTQA